MGHPKPTSTVTVKTCRRCGAAKPVEEFPRAFARKDGRAMWCSTCKNAHDRAAYLSDPNRYTARRERERRRRAREEAGIARPPPVVYQPPPEPERNKLTASRRSHLKRTYGLTIDDYARMYTEQDGRCAICGRAEIDRHPRTGTLRSLSIDHDPTTGAIRALLCSNCNKAIGLLWHDIERVEKAAAYLRRHA